MKQISAVFLILALFTSSLHAFTWDRCQLARTLVRKGVPFSRYTIDEWMCLIQYESSFNQTAKGGPNGNGSYDWGLFQINDTYWCRIVGVGLDCNMNCDSLLDANLDDDIECVKKIYNRHGFSAWHAWTNRCQNMGTFYDHSHCFEE